MKEELLELLKKTESTLWANGQITLAEEISDFLKKWFPFD